MNEHQAGIFLNTIHRCFSPCLPLTMLMISLDVCPKVMMDILCMLIGWQHPQEMWCNSTTCWDWLFNHVQSRLIIQNIKTLNTKLTVCNMVDCKKWKNTQASNHHQLKKKTIQTLSKPKRWHQQTHESLRWRSWRCKDDFNADKQGRIQNRMIVSKNAPTIFFYSCCVKTSFWGTLCCHDFWSKKTSQVFSGHLFSMFISFNPFAIQIVAEKVRKGNPVGPPAHSLVLLRCKAQPKPSSLELIYLIPALQRPGPSNPTQVWLQQTTFWWLGAFRVVIQYLIQSHLKLVVFFWVLPNHV